MQADTTQEHELRLPLGTEKEIATIVHEFNNLLSIIQIQNQELQHKTSDSPETTLLIQKTLRTIARMKNANERLYRLVDRNEHQVIELELQGKDLHPRGLNSGVRVGTILLVEDEKEFSQILKRKLEREGYSVICAQRFSEAREIVDQSPSRITAVISDDNLPDGRGRDLLAYAQAKNQELQLILTSGLPLNPATPNITSLRKPFSFEDLIQAIHF